MEGERKDVKYSFSGKASSSFFFPNTSKTVPIDAQATQKKVFLRLMNFIIVLLLETISWPGKTSKRFVDLCAHFKPIHSKNHFVAKKVFFSFTCVLILDANLNSIERLKNILRFFTCALNLFKPKIKFLFQTILILSQFVEKMN